MKLSKIFLILLVFLFPTSPAQYKINRSVFGNGIGMVNNSTYTVNTVIGQAGIGLSSNTSHQCHFGFWYSIVIYVPIVEEFENQLPTKYELFQNYPNPFNSITNIKFSLPKSDFVTLRIYNLIGQEVAILISDDLSPGNFKYTWDASDFASGIYYYQIMTKNFIQTKKLLLLK